MLTPEQRAAMDATLKDSGLTPDRRSAMDAALAESGLDTADVKLPAFGETDTSGGSDVTSLSPSFENKPDRSVNMNTLQGVVPMLTELAKVGGATLRAPINVPIRGMVESILPSTAMARKAQELKQPLPPAIEALEPRTEDERRARTGGAMLGKLAQSAAYYGLAPEVGGASLLGKLATPVVKNIAGTVPFAAEYDKPEQFGIDALLGIAADLGTRGAGKVISGAREMVPRGAPKLPAQQAEEALAQTLKEAKTIQEGPVVAAEQTMAKPKQLSMPERLWRGLGDTMIEADWRGIQEQPAPRTIPFPAYAKQSNLASRKYGEMDPLELVNQRATEELKLANEERKRIGGNIDVFLAANNNVTVPATGWLEELDNLTSQYVGGKLTFVDGVPKVVDDVTPIIDPEAAAMVEKMAAQIAPAKVGEAVPIRYANGLKQAIRNNATYVNMGGIYNNSKASAIADALGGKIANDIVAALPDEQAVQLATLNQQYGKAREAVIAMGKILGPEVIGGSGISRHGGQIAKRAIQSSAPGDIRAAFRAIKELTGADLMQDATYATLAMRLSGDPTQVRKASQFGGMMNEELLKSAMQGQTMIGMAKQAASAFGKGGRLQAISDFYTNAHGMPRVDVGTREFVQPVQEKKFTELMEELARGESGAVGASRPFDQASGATLADDIGAHGGAVGKMYSRQEMINAGADGSLEKGLLKKIPVNDIDGLEPIPSAAEGKPYAVGSKVTQPIEVSYDAANGKYMLYSGNHRVQQAKTNGDKYIDAFVEPDISTGETGAVGAGSGIDLLTRMAAGGGVGGTVGAQVGDTPEERRRNMLLGAGVGMAGSPAITKGMTDILTQAARR